MVEKRALSSFINARGTWNCMKSSRERRAVARIKGEGREKNTESEERGREVNRGEHQMMLGTNPVPKVAQFRG